MKYTTYFSICLALRRKKVYTLITVHSGKVVWKKDQIDNMEEEMKKMVKRTAVVTLAGVMSVGMLSGCGSKTLDGTKTVATVDGTDIPLWSCKSLCPRTATADNNHVFKLYGKCR